VAQCLNQLRRHVKRIGAAKLCCKVTTAVTADNINGSRMSALVTTEEGEVVPVHPT